MTDNFGKKEYFERLFSLSSLTEDPWGHNWRASQQFRYDSYLKLLRFNNLDKKRLNILDIGCSLGDFTARVERALKPREIWAIDISEVAIEKARIKYKNSKINFKVGSLPNLVEFKDNSFNLLLSLEVLYYMAKEDRIKALKEMKRVLKKDGFILISVNINKPPYFQIYEFYNLVGQFFKIEKVEYNYGKIYSFFENRIFVLEKTVFKKFIRYILSIEILVIISQFLTKIILGRKGITLMCVLAKKIED